MSIVNPVTAGNELARGFALRQATSVSPLDSEQLAVDPFVRDRVSISSQARQRQQQETQLQSSRDGAELPNNSVSVSSSTGGSRSRANLTELQAIALYQRVASLL